MRSQILWLSLVLSIPVFAQNAIAPEVAQDADEVIDLKVGDSRVLIIPDVTRIAVGDPTIADVSIVDSQQLLLEAKGAGTTTLLLWKRDGSRRNTVIRVR